MKYLVTVLLCIVLNHGFSQGVNEITWNESKKLEWSDFKGAAADTIITQYEAEAAAVSSVYIDWFSFDNSAEAYTLCAYFDKNKSWYSDSSALLLQHEQLHFDIYELYARKMRSALDSLRKEGLADSLVFNSSTIELLDEKLKAYTFEYDRETMHGAIKTVQNKWNERVASELKEWENYSSNSLGCKCDRIN